MRQFAALFLTLCLMLAPVRAAEVVPRGEFVQELWTLWGSVPYEDTFRFTDLPHDTPYTSAVCWAHDLGLVLGVGERRFAPECPITREEAALFLRRAAAHIGRDTALSSPSPGGSPWAEGALHWAVETGLLASEENAPLTPDEARTMLDRFDRP